ncbi:MAG: phosphotransferase, partial [Pseudomonadota bacterium]|nr:phosphotransferase [Pseudomonadota bacterium]
MNIERLIDQLCLPQTYPHAVEVITTIETHISVVFLTGEFAYKLKKPVDFGFLNFTQKADREFFCQQELRLNRRTAPDLYLDVVPIYQTADGEVSFHQPQAPVSNQEPIDYLVKMNQFEPNWVLGRYLRDHSITLEQESLLAKRIADLHQTANLVATESHLGEPETLLQPMLDNFPTLLENCSSDYKPRLQALLDWTNQQFKLLRPLLIKRKQQGFIRECHGDLHLDNITLINDTPTLFDGIEFNDEFRWIDGISDLAFLLIDLEFRGQPAFKRRILSQYLEITGDYAALELLSFYQVYRSLVRAKISALRLSQLTKGSLEHNHF